MAATARPHSPARVVREIAASGGVPSIREIAATAVPRATGGLHRVAFACLALSIPLSTLNALRPTSFLSFGDPLLVLAGVFVALRCVRPGLRRGAIPLWLPSAAAGIVLAGLIAAFRGNVGNDLLPTLEFAGTLFGLPVVALVLIDTPRRLERTVELWLFAASISALVGVADLGAHLNIGLGLTGIDYVRYTNRAVGLTLHPNHLGLVSAMALPVALMRAIRPPASRHGLGATVRNFGYVFLLAAGLLVSGSRAGLIAVVAALIALPLLQSVGHRVGRVLALPVLIVGLLGLVVLDGPLARSLGLVAGSRLTGVAVGTGSSDDYRITAYTKVLHQFVHDPLVGQGFDAARVAHSIYFQLLQAGGIIALIAFVLFAVGAFRLRREIELRPVRVPSSDLAVAFNASLIAWLVDGAAQNELYDRFLFIPVALLFALRQMNRRHTRRSSVSRRQQTA